MTKSGLFKLVMIHLYESQPTNQLVMSPNKPLQTDFKSAASRSCDDQKNACAKIANGDNSNGLKVSDCDDQRDTCKSAQEKATVTSFGSSASGQAQVVTSDDEFTYFCDP
jgi:hypothetical protein